MKIFQRRIDIVEGADADDLKAAKQDAKNHTKGVLPKLPFIEADPSWVLLYNHARKGQITSKIMRRMKRADLYFLAGMTFPHPALMQPETVEERLDEWTLGAEERWDQVTKLQGNAARAKIELQRRNFFWASSFTVLAALAGGFVGGLLSN